MKILLIDGYNSFFIARSGFVAGEFSTVYNFFRWLKAQITLHEPDRVVIALEGEPKKRLELLSSYKQNRVIDPSDQDKLKKQDDFARQKNIIVKALCEMFPVSVVRHPSFEADDTIYNLICNASSITQWTVVSTDTDFFQLFQGETREKNVKLYNSVKKKFCEPTEYDYVTWKALRGDPTDNIIGIAGIGEKRAAVLASKDIKDIELKTPEEMLQFQMNLKLIRFERWTEEETLLMESSKEHDIDFEKIKSFFESMQFSSLIKEPYWNKFVSTFTKLTQCK